ncbi:MAG TPA: thioredoxin domain-containing protein [Burkholderiales bacterium]
MKPETQNKLAITVVVAAVVVAAAALIMVMRMSYPPDEARVMRLIEQQLAKQDGSAAVPALTEARVVRLIEERLPAMESAGKGISEARLKKLIDERLAGKSALPDKEFEARVEKGIVAFIEKQRRAEQERPNQLARNLPRPNKSDHIYGNPTAPVTLIEYSDFECPFCKRFHDSVKQVVDASKGQVKWVYRHFPIEQLHPVKARKEAVAAECAGELGGHDAFWKFADRFFELTPSNNRTDVDTVLPQIAREIGLDEKQFASCVASGRHDQRIDKDIRDAQTSGANGTPWSVIVSKGGKTYVLSGAQPQAAIKQLTELALQEK